MPRLWTACWPSPSPPSCSCCCRQPWPSVQTVGTVTGFLPHTPSGNQRRRPSTARSPSRRRRSADRPPQTPSWNTQTHTRYVNIQVIHLFGTAAASSQIRLERKEFSQSSRCDCKHLSRNYFCICVPACVCVHALCWHKCVYHGHIVGTLLLFEDKKQVSIAEGWRWWWIYSRWGQCKSPGNDFKTL